jgi:hypothetical protein
MEGKDERTELERRVGAPAETSAEILRRRVTSEAHIEAAMGDHMGDLMAEAALPGMFASGKTVTGSESGTRGDDMFITFKFDDGSEMTIIGKYQVHANQP